MHMWDRVEHRGPHNRNLQSNRPVNHVRLYSLQIQDGHCDSILPRDKVCSDMGISDLYFYDTCSHDGVLCGSFAQAEVDCGSIHTELFVHRWVNLCAWMAHRLFKVSDNWDSLRRWRGICPSGSDSGLHGFLVPYSHSLCIHCPRLLPWSEILLQVLKEPQQERWEESSQLLYASKRIKFYLLRRRAQTQWYRAWKHKK